MAYNQVRKWCGMRCNKQNRVKEVNLSKYTAIRENTLISLSGISAQPGALSDMLVHECMQHGESVGGIRGLNALAELQNLIGITVMSWHSSHMGVVQLMDTGSLMRTGREGRN